MSSHDSQEDFLFNLYCVPGMFPGVGESTVSEFFVPFSEVTEEHLGNYHGFWGMVVDARKNDRGTLWFNSGGREDASVLLDGSSIEASYRRFHIADEEDIAGAYILVLGELRHARYGKNTLR